MAKNIWFGLFIEGSSDGKGLIRDEVSRRTRTSSLGRKTKSRRGRLLLLTLGAALIFIPAGFSFDVQLRRGLMSRGVSPSLPSIPRLYVHHHEKGD